jgi:hypothetical protein
MTKQAVPFVIPSTPADIKDIIAVFNDMSNNATKAEAIKDYLSEAKKGLKEKYGIPLSIINKLFKLYHLQNSVEFFDQTRMLEEFFTIIEEKENVV